jgi:cell division protein FtsL
MNTMSKSGEQHLVSFKFLLPELSWSNLLLSLFVLLTVISAFSVVYCREITREMTSDLQNLHYQTDKMILQHNQLMVEKTALSTEERVADVASTRLNMEIPKAHILLMVTS